MGLEASILGRDHRPNPVSNGALPPLGKSKDMMKQLKPQISRLRQLAATAQFEVASNCHFFKRYKWMQMLEAVPGNEASKFQKTWTLFSLQKSFFTQPKRQAEVVPTKPCHASCKVVPVPPKTVNTIILSNEKKHR